MITERARPKRKTAKKAKARAPLREVPFKITDKYGRQREVLAEDFSIVEEEEDPGKPWVIHALLTLSTSRRTFRYNDGTPWDSGEAYA